MRTVLSSTAARIGVVLALTGGLGAAVVAPALAAGPHGSPAGVQHGAVTNPETEIGTAVAYVRDPDGTVRRIRG